MTGSRSIGRSGLVPTGSLGLAALLAAAVLAAACGDDARETPDGSPGDAGSDGPPPFPPAPAIGAQLDRAGRPLILTALIAPFETGAMQMTKRDAYGTASDPATWATTALGTGPTIAREIESNLAALDVLDQGHAMVPQPNGCRNQLVYNGNVNGGGTPSDLSYDLLAGILADDMIYVDTSKAMCPRYLDLELEIATDRTSTHVGCGGRMPTHDVVDMTYSALTAGIAGFGTGFAPRIVDQVTAHPDITSAFPYFGEPR